MADLIELLGKRSTYQPVGDPQFASHKVTRRDSPERLAYILKSLVGHTVLDIGCNSGYFTREIARKGFQVTGLDKDRRMIEAAELLDGNLGINYVCGDWKDVLPSLGAFANILYLAVIHHDISKIGLEETLVKLANFKAQRVFIEVPNHSPIDFHKEMPRIAEAMGKTVVDSHTIRRTIYVLESVKHPRGVVMLITPQQAQEWLDRSKFQTVRPDKLSGYVRDIEEGNWRAGTEGSPLSIIGGKIGNGYHRVRAIIEAKKEVEMLVRFKEV